MAGETQLVKVSEAETVLAQPAAQAALGESLAFIQGLVTYAGLAWCGSLGVVNRSVAYRCGRCDGARFSLGVKKIDTQAKLS